MAKRGKRLISLADKFLLVAMLPFLGGCLPGGGLGLGALFGLFGGAAGGLGGLLAALGGGGAAGGGLGGALGVAAGAGIASEVVATGAGIATISNPEPTSIILVGSGLAAMSYMKNRKNRS